MLPSTISRIASVSSAPVVAGMPRVVFLTVMPTPYMQDLFQGIVDAGRIDLRVLYMEMAAPDTYWEPPELPAYARLLPGRWIGFAGGRLHLNGGLFRALRAVKPDLVIVGGYAGFTLQAAMFWLRAARLPWVFFGELPGMRQRSLVGRALRWFAQRPALRWSDGIIGVGARATRAYTELTRGRLPVWNIPYHCDLRPFLSIPRPRSANIAAKVRFLYCGQLIERKGVDILLRAFCRIGARRDGVELTFVGDGPLRNELEKSVPEALKQRVHFAGFRQVADLPAFFGAADVFILPSRHDGWGVVVNQAVAAGMPVIVSDAVGSAEDLVRPWQNGVICRAGDEDSLADALDIFAAAPEKIADYSACSRELSESFTIARGAEAFQRVCHEVLNRRGKCT